MDKPKVYLKQLIEGTIEILFYMEVSGLTHLVLAGFVQSIPLKVQQQAYF